MRVVQGETVTYFSSDEHCNFPRYVRLPNGDAYISHSLGRHMVTERRRRLVSHDSGKTWKQTESRVPSVVLSDGTCLAIDFCGKQTDERSFEFQVHRSKNNWKSISVKKQRNFFPIIPGEEISGRLRILSLPLRWGKKS